MVYSLHKVGIRFKRPSDGKFSKKLSIVTPDKREAHEWEAAAVKTAREEGWGLQMSKVSNAKTFGALNVSQKKWNAIFAAKKKRKPKQM